MNAPSVHPGVAALRAQVAGEPLSASELIAHVVRRLGIGASARDLDAAETVEDAIERSLDLSTPPAPLPPFEPPADIQAARDPQTIQIPLGHWLEQMVVSTRRIEERLVWFWHDHFATGFRKVRIPYLMWQQHRTVRQHATGRFDELLKGIARDPAMLDYLDGRTNRAGAINENFAREVMELHTMGRGTYTQDDVVAAARAFTGWVIAPGADDRRRRVLDAEPWSAVFIPDRFDDGTKTLLGVTGDHDMDDALDIILEQPETADSVAAKLFVELTGLSPDDPTVARLGAVFRTDWDVMRLVEEIVSDPVFVSNDAVRSRVRTPVERLVGVVQGVETSTQAARAAFGMLHSVGFVPFNPPNPAGFPSGTRLLGPYHLAHSLDIGGVLAEPPDYPVDELFARLGLFDVSNTTRQVVADAPSPATRITLAASSPEYALT